MLLGRTVSPRSRASHRAFPRIVLNVNLKHNDVYVYRKERESERENFSKFLSTVLSDLHATHS